ENQGQRVQRFDSDGNWERLWGLDVNGGSGFEICTVASSCTVADAGSDAGAMLFPLGLATVGGKVYVSDTANNRVQRFDAEGKWERLWGVAVDRNPPDE